MHIIITDHAVARYRERHAPQLTQAEARAYLETASQSAARLKDKSIKGSQIWKIEDALLCMKQDNGAHICLTVLPKRPFDAPVSDDTLDEIEAFQSILTEEKSLPTLQRPQSTKASEKTPKEKKREMAALTRFSREMATIASRLSLEEEKTKRMEIDRQFKLEHNRQQRHAARMQADSDRAKKALKIALREASPEVLAAVAEIDPGFATKDFIDSISQDDKREMTAPVDRKDGEGRTDADR